MRKGSTLGVSALLRVVDVEEEDHGDPVVDLVLELLFGGVWFDYYQVVYQTLVFVHLDFPLLALNLLESLLDCE